MQTTPNAWCNDDLAYIHDVGFRDYTLNAMPGILAILQRHLIGPGLVVDLGCGSGLSAQALHQVGYSVLGIDISAAMIAIARTRVPAAEFQVASLLTAAIPPCVAVIAIGECLNYTFDEPSDQALQSLFQRLYTALMPGGVFIFDGVVAGQVPPRAVVKSFTEGQDWVVLVEKHEDPEQQLLTRRIVTFRQVNEHYRRMEEVHQQRLFDLPTLTAHLNSTGFQVEMTDCYGAFRLPPARFVAIAHKPR